MQSFNIGKGFALGNSLLRVVKLIKNANLDKYKYSGYGIGIDARGKFSLSDSSGIGGNKIMFGTDMSLLVHIDNVNLDILQNNYVMKFVPGEMNSGYIVEIKAKNLTLDMMFE